MDRSIVKESMKILDQKAYNQIEEEKCREVSDRIKNIERKMSDIFDKLSILLEDKVEKRDKLANL